MRRRLAALLSACAVALTLSACRRETPADSGAVLYFLATEEQTGAYVDFAPGSALETEPFDPATCTTVHREDSPCPDPGCLLAALLAGPGNEGLRSPFPRNTTLKSWSWGDEEGRLRVVLSEQYSGLTDISLTLADHCIALTLCQLEGVDSVEIITSGYSSVYRGRQVLTGEDALLDSGLAELAGGV